MKRLLTCLLTILLTLALFTGATTEGMYSDEAEGARDVCAEPIEEAVPEADLLSLGREDIADIPKDNISLDHAVSAWEGGDSEIIDDGVVYNFTINDMGWLTGYDGEHTEVVVPEGVVGIGSYAFRFNNTIESIVLPEGLTRISSNAFTDMGKLSKINIPSTVTRIEDSAFYGTKITEIDIPDSVEVLGRFVFQNCSQLKRVRLPSGITILPWGMFTHCTSLTSFEIPNTVTKIEGCCFSYSGLRSIVIPDSVTVIGTSCFSDCKDLSSATIPGSVQRLGPDDEVMYIFDSCTRLTEVNLGEGIINIGAADFMGCTALTSITLPSSVTSIGIHAFRRCTALTDIYLEGDKLVSIPRPDDLFVASEVPSIKNIIFHTHCDTDTTKLLKSRGYTVSKTAHTPVADEDIPATCLEAGSRGGTHCSRCNTVITAAEYLPPTGHKPVTDPAIAPTYTTTGLTEGVHCASCGAVITPQQVVPMLEPEPTVKPSADPSADPDSPAPSGPVAATGISLNRAGTVTLEKGKALQLRGIVDPYNADTTLTWSSGKTGVAVVDRTGRVIAVGTGTAVITVSTDNGLTASVTISVPEAGSSDTPATEPGGVKLNVSKKTLKVSKTLTLKATLTPAGTESALKWSSSNKNVAKVSSKGKVTALVPGTATISVTTANGMTAKAKVTVKADKPKSVALNKKKLTLKKNKTAQLTVTFSPKTAYSSLTWSSSNKKVATVTKAGKVKAVGKGTATITAKTKNGLKAKVKITVP